jgi:hypothetical protein
MGGLFNSGANDAAQARVNPIRRVASGNSGANLKRFRQGFSKPASAKRFARGK